MEEIWKDIKGYVGFYQVSNLGRVRSVEREIYKSNNVKQISKSSILKFEKSKGYNYVHLFKNGTRKRIAVHRLVAEAFILNPNNLPEVDHINTIRDDNRVENLRWVTPKENMNNPLTKEKRCGYQGNKSEEIKKKISKAQSIKVVQLTLEGELVKIWDSAIKAQKECGFDNGNINRCCRSKYKTNKGYKWTYYEDYIKLKGRDVQ